METKKLLNYIIDILEITEFKSYYYENANSFTGVAKNSFLKALDIPPKFFKEQPEETQAELLDNREIFVAETKKYFDKVIVVIKTEFGDTLNACRMDRKEAYASFDKLQTIEKVSNKFEHRAFIKDGYTTVIVSNSDIKKGIENKVLVIDYPILLNKKAVIHNATYRLPDDTFVTPIEHIQYFSNDEIVLLGDDANYNNVEEAVNDHLDYLESPETKSENLPILRENEVIALALVQGNFIPKSGRDKVEKYLNDHVEGELHTKKLEQLVLDFDETFNSYKQVLSLRNISGVQILDILNSDSFKELTSEMAEQLD